MRWRYILNTVGILLLFLGLSMSFSLFWGLYYDDGSVVPLLMSMVITVISGFL